MIFWYKNYYYGSLLTPNCLHPSVLSHSIKLSPYIVALWSHSQVFLQSPTFNLYSCWLHLYVRPAVSLSVPALSLLTILKCWINFKQISPDHISWYDHKYLTSSSVPWSPKFSWPDSQPPYPPAPLPKSCLLLWSIESRNNDSDLLGPALLCLVLFQSVAGPPPPGSYSCQSSSCHLRSTIYKAFFTIFCFNYQIHQNSVYPVLVSLLRKTAHFSQDRVPLLHALRLKDNDF